jgi:hypothetical protein
MTRKAPESIGFGFMQAASAAVIKRRDGMKSSISALFVAGTIAATVAPAMAHHNANAQWQTDKRLEINGTLKEVRDISPHAHWLFDIKDAATGKVDTWDFEGISANALRRQGIMIKQVIKPGQDYKVVYSPSRDGSKAGFLVGIYIDGKRVDFLRV